MKKNKILITESTKEFVEKELQKDIEEMEEDELVRKINESKKAVAKKNTDGTIEVKQSLNG